MKKNKHRLLTVSALISLTSTSIFFINKAISASAVIKNLLKGNPRILWLAFWKDSLQNTRKWFSLLLIHDVSPCCSTDEWKYLCDALAVDHTVYSIDLLGCGCSDRPKITYTNFLYVQLITDFIHNVIKKKTDVITSGLSGSFCCYGVSKWWDHHQSYSDDQPWRSCCTESGSHKKIKSSQVYFRIAPDWYSIV